MPHILWRMCSFLLSITTRIKGVAQDRHSVARDSFSYITWKIINLSARTLVLLMRKALDGCRFRETGRQLKVHGTNVNGYLDE
eukprot:scaffold4658_cov118-Cylindrotheca_fusiformis.AAC.10